MHEEVSARDMTASCIYLERNLEMRRPTSLSPVDEVEPEDDESEHERTLPSEQEGKGNGPGWWKRLISFLLRSIRCVWGGERARMGAH
jgi:hypothetical protein